MTGKKPYLKKKIKRKLPDIPSAKPFLSKGKPEMEPTEMKSLINRKHSRQLKIYVFRRIKEIVFEYRNKRKNKNDLLKSKKKDKNTENRMTGFHNVLPR